ncbi:retrovirus-related pol polyprotein from transposon TNT 1-94 [Tanacetum coccineum]
MKADGTIDKYKARLVIKGFRQREGLDYFDTYSPVTRITSIRMILAIAALRNLEVQQMDVKTAFLNGDLEEEIYMNQPEGFIAPGQEGKFTSSGYVILCLYVDDMLIVGSNDKMIKSTKDMLKSKFDMKDMGLADVILGIKIIRTQNGLVLSQAHYVDKILNTHNAGDSGQARTPIDTSTRPDLAYAVSRLSRYTSNPSYAHWKAITRVLHYLRYSRDYGLHYDRHPAVIEGYSDANWISDIKDSRSTSGYVFTLGGAAISWKSSNKGVISIDYVASKDNIADPFTKGLSRELVSKLSSPAVTTAFGDVPWKPDGEISSATLNIQAFKIKKSVSISFRMTQVHKMAKDHMMMIKDYDWMMISKKLKDHIQVKLKPKSLKFTASDSQDTDQ